MPTYEYACTECGHRLEAVQKFTDEPLSECPECGAPLRKVYGAVGIVLKGSGFYKTDSRAAAAGSGSNGKSPTDGEKTKGGDPASNGGSTPSGESASGSGTGSDSSKKEKSPDAKPAASTSS